MKSSPQQSLFDFDRGISIIREPREQAHIKVKEKAPDVYFKLVKAMLHSKEPVNADSVTTISVANTARSRMHYLAKRNICYLVDDLGKSVTGSAQSRYTLTDEVKRK